MTLRGEDPTSSPSGLLLTGATMLVEESGRLKALLMKGCWREVRGWGREAVAKSGALCKSLFGKVPLPLGVRRALAKFKSKNQSFLPLGFS